MEQAVWQRYRDAGLVFWGINIDEPKPVVEDFVREFQVTFTTLLGNSDLYDAFTIGGRHVSPYPRDFIVGRQGTIAYASDMFDPDEIERVLAAELGLETTAVEGEVEQHSSPLQTLALDQSVPNPVDLAAGQSIRIDFVSSSGPASLMVYNTTGQLVRTLEITTTAGAHAIVWDGRDAAGRQVASGTYVVQLRGQGQARSRKLTILR